MKAHLGILSAAAMGAAILSSPLALASLSGKKFDRAFVKAMVKDHKQDIAKYTKEAKTSNSPASNYAETVLPDLHKHLRMAESLERNRG